MQYRVKVARRVRRQIEGLPGHMRQRIKREIAKLAFNPRPDYAEELRGNLQGLYKLKLDQHRIVYRIDEDIAVVEVLKAGKKHDAFYDDLK